MSPDPKEVLIEAGFDITTATNGFEALAALDKDGQDLAGLISDIRLGEGPDGWDVARHARELAPAFPVVYMSGDSVAYWSAQGVPNSEILQKPFAAVQLVTAISNFLNEVAKGVTK
jgi:CheY-like chemotaxis protein